MKYQIKAKKKQRSKLINPVFTVSYTLGYPFNTVILLHLAM